jgi:hypothetical protein
MYGHDWGWGALHRDLGGSELCEDIDDIYQFCIQYYGVWETEYNIKCNILLFHFYQW